MALTLVGFQYHDTRAVLLAGTGAVGLLGRKLLSDAHPANMRRRGSTPSFASRM
jgi:hypothetical protein